VLYPRPHYYTKNRPSFPEGRLNFAVARPPGARVLFRVYFGSATVTPLAHQHNHSMPRRRYKRKHHSNRCGQANRRLPGSTPKSLQLHTIAIPTTVRRTHYSGYSLVTLPEFRHYTSFFLHSMLN